MKSKFNQLIVRFLIFLKNRLLSNQKFRVLLYDIHNKEEFGNLYEHEKMLADSVRINMYKSAIKKYIGPNDIVLDLGTGTGILAFFAAKQKAKKVYAIDHSDFINVAREVAKHNKFENIEFIQTNSRNFKPKVKIDIIIHEQIGDYLFNENMIQNLMDLKNRVLKLGGRIIPGKFELYLEPVHLKDSFNVPFIWENELYGVDFGFLRKHFKSLEEFKPQDYKQEWLDSEAIEDFLCETDPIYSFDLNTLKSEKDVPHSIQCTKHVVKPGYLDAFCLYFNVKFDDDIQFDTSPLTPATHWGNCFFRIESRKCFGEELIDYTFTMPDLFDITTWNVIINFIGKGREQPQIAE